MVGLVHWGGVGGWVGGRVGMDGWMKEVAMGCYRVMCMNGCSYLII